ncbi:radical SAM/SPASM domain-containing protein [Kitasatospora purpeofusca]|uniref:Radical SAM protein n=1 Tax=Kitasatospora purpeofusca TaxID=67352 RepID=A0ABZ1U690_9ACTN|nr:radical SAM protein [Kitasatospora purpeofusca]
MQLRVSRYLILSEGSFRNADGFSVRIACLTSTARTYVLDARIADALQADEAEGLDGPTADRLLALGLLVPEGADEALDVVRVSKRAVRERRVRTFVVMPSNYCNMACEYCGQEHEKRTIAPRAERLVERVRRAAATEGTDHLHIGWFGGEPLMAYDVLRRLALAFLAVAAEENCGYTSKLVTNGSLLSHRKLRDLHLKYGLTELEVTIDGTRDYHDKSRVLKGGWRSFDRVVGMLGEAAADPDLARLDVTVRTNVGAANAGMAAEYADAMAAAGLAGSRVSFYPTVIHTWGNDVTELTVTKQRYADIELSWFEEFARVGLNHALLPSTTKPIVCVAVDPSSEVVDATGGLFSCTEQPLVPGYEGTRLGNIETLPLEVRRPAGRYDDWHAGVESGTETPCRSCRVLPICGGGCPKHWREGTMPCPSYKYNLPGRLDLYGRRLGLRKEADGACAG